MMRTQLVVGQVQHCRTFKSRSSDSMVEIVERFAHSNGRQNKILFNLRHLSCFFVSLIFSVIFLNSWTTTLANPVFVENSHFGHFQTGRNIRNLPCIVRKSGKSGVCMFAIDCIKQNGTHLGTCIDRFYFGSCCQLKDETLFAPEITDNSIDQNTIAHFVHESTTLRTSSIFKPTSDSHPTGNVKNVTHSLSTSITSSHPVSSTTEPPSRGPSIHTTTYKSSHFVIRTTPKPQHNKNKANTTAKPLRRKTTTTTKPILTTVQHVPEQRIETTTVPTRIVTFQMVETTNPSITEPTRADEQQPPLQQQPQTLQPKPSTSKPIPIEINANTTTTSKINQTTPAPSSTTSKTKIKPPATKRPSTTKPTAQNITANKVPVHTKKPTSKPSKINVTEAIESVNAKITDKPPPLKPLISLDLNKNFTGIVNITTDKPIYKPYRTTPTPATKMPTPKPQQKTTTTKPKIPVTSTNTVSAKPKPPPTKISAKITTTSTTTTTTTTPRTTSSETSTVKSTTSGSTTSAPSIATTLSSTSTSTTPKTILNATAGVSVETEAVKEQYSSTTPSKPGLVTWSNIDAEPVTNASSEMDWQPRPPPDWIIVSTIAPESTSKLSHETTTEKINAFITEEPLILNSTSSTTTDHAATSSATKSPTLEVSSTTESTATTESILEQETTTSEFIDFTTINPLIGEKNETLSTTSMISSFEEVNYKQICGRRMFPEPRIVGGANSAFGRWPWQVSLRQWRTSTYLHKCGAALLNENWAITAAHCVDNVPPSDLLLRLGEYDLAEEEEPYGYQERRVQIVASHPQFDPRTFEYDLALLRFYEPVIFQPNIIPVCVPESDYDFIGQTAFVTGWGRLYEDGPLPSVLQEVAVPVINNTICESMYRVAGYIEHIPHIFICAGWKKGGYDSCEGDSGGPMVLQREEDKRFVLGGVISWGIGCAEANQPGVYTRISEFRDWINQILQF